MPFPKGKSGNPKGKPPGPNKKTAEFRETVRMLLEDNAENFAKWLQQVAEGIPAHDIKPNPAKALDCMAGLAEYASPKLARTEHTGEGGGPLTVEIVRFGDK